MTRERSVEHRADLQGMACVLMAKVPLPGRVKTRLFPYLDEETTASLYTCFLQDMVSAIEAAHPGLCRVAYTPADGGGLLKRLLPESCSIMPQSGAHLGERLYNLFNHLLVARGMRGVLAINSDSPTLPMALVTEALSRLHEPGVDGVIGPAEDGGYYLIGLSRPHKYLFADIPWSTAEVLSTTLGRAEEAGLKIVLLDPWYDVDDGEGLLRLWEELRWSRTGGPAPATRACLHRLEAEGKLGAVSALLRAER